MGQWVSTVRRGLAARGAVLVMGLTLALPPPAQACGQCMCEGSRPWLLPVGARSLPLDARLLVSVPGKTRESLALRQLDGTPVPFHVEDTGGPAHTAWLVPDAPLAPDTEHVLFTGGEELARFRSGTSTGAQAPTLGGVRAAPVSVAETCGATLGASFALVDATTSQNGFALQVDVELREGTRRIFIPGVTLSSLYSLGHANADTTSGLPCLGMAELGAREPGPLRLTVRVVDGTGLLSAPQVLEGLQLERVTAGGCGMEPRGGCAAGGEATVAAGLLLLLGLGRRARRTP